MYISRNVYGQLLEMVVECGAKKATKYISEKYVIKATRHGKPDSRDVLAVVVVTAGRPNYDERQFIKAHKKAGRKFPIASLVTKFPPPKKRANRVR